jgi:hypothetical protein
MRQNVKEKARPIWSPLPDEARTTLVGLSLKKRFINQEKLLDKAVLILNYKRSNDL